MTSLSTDRILIAAVDMLENKHTIFPALHLDIGAGEGDLINLLHSKHNLTSVACDYTNELLKLNNIKLDIVDLNTEKLPYSTNHFDIVTCTEVIEHLENPRETIREIYRVLKNQGTIVMTTPNILNLKSRIRYLLFGFYNLFGPLHFKESKLYSTGGHITPISLFYIIHALVDAGFHDIKVDIDKKQTTSMLWLGLLYIPIKIFSKIFRKSEINKYKTIDENNNPWVDRMNATDILLGRTIIIGAKK